MKDSNILFHVEDCDFSLEKTDMLSSLLNDFVVKQNNSCGDINYIFCSDRYLLDLNKKYLNHDYFTDILSFQMNEEPIEGDIFISIERVRDNAENLNIPFNEEILRVISHGLLHFLGYKDKTEEEKNEMRAMENELISFLNDFSATIL